MTGLESIPLINGLFIQLIDRVKDRQTASLVGQVQALFQSVQAGYFAAEHKALETATQNLKLTRQVAALEDSQPKTIAALQESQAAAIAALRNSQSAQIAQLVTKHQAEIERLNKRIADLTPKPVKRMTAGQFAGHVSTPSKRTKPLNVIAPGNARTRTPDA